MIDLKQYNELLSLKKELENQLSEVKYKISRKIDFITNDIKNKLHDLINKNLHRNNLNWSLSERHIIDKQNKIISYSFRVEEYI